MSVQISRRELVGGGLVLGAFALTGCKGHGEDLPGPVAATGQQPPVYVPPTMPQPLPRNPPRSQAAAGDPGVLPRSAWTRTGVARPDDINPLNGVQRITIHHDGMDVFTSTDQAECARRIELIRKSHVMGARGNKPFADIGYHYIIDPAGRIWEGRNIRYQGAHVQDNNENNLGIMCLGNFDQQRPSAATKSSLDRFVATQMRKYGVSISRVKTHQEINPTHCPGSNMQQYMLATRGPSGPLRLAMASTPWALA